MKRFVPRSSIVLFLALSVALPSCGPGSTSDAADGADQHVVNYDSADVRLVSTKDTVRLRALLAMTAEQKTMGTHGATTRTRRDGYALRLRLHAAARRGLLDVSNENPARHCVPRFDRERYAPYSMVPCTAVLAQGCSTYAPNVAYRYALEVNKGYFARHGLTTGSRLVLADIRR